MKKCCLFILAIGLGYFAFPQENPTPQLPRKANAVPHDTAKTAALQALALLKNHRTPDLANAEMEAANYYSYCDSAGNKRRVTLYRDAALLYEKAGMKLQQGNALEMLGDLLQVQNRTLNEALPPLLQAFRLYRAVHMDNLGNLGALLASVYSRMGDHHAALIYGRIAVEREEAKSPQCRSLGTAYNRLGMVYYNMPDYTRADTAFIHALAAARRFQDTDGIKIIAANLLYTKLKLHQPDSATFILHDLAQHFPFTSSDLANTIAAQLIRFEAANTGAYTTRDLIATALFDYGLAVKDYSLARQSAGKRLDLCRGNPYSPALYKSYYQLYEVDSAEGRYHAAMANYQHYVALRDSLQKETANNQLTTFEIQATHSADSTDRRTDFPGARRPHSTWPWLIAAAAILLISGPLLYNRYRIARRNRQLQAEKDWLLNELHHRVKNNLQIVISLLSTQSIYLDNEKAQAAIGQSRNRMYALSLIHQRLYQNDNLEWVDMSRYISDLVEYLRDNFPKQRHILFHFDIDPQPLEVATAIPLGLILNEAITNSLQYAFPEKRAEKHLEKQPANHAGKSPGAKPGNIHIRLRPQQGLLLEITDDGIGLDGDFDAQHQHSMGIQLIETLVQQLEGTMTITGDQGVRISIQIPPQNEA
jgi:two-component sensor histidine kinase